MRITEVYKLKTGSPVWIWVVQFARGRWWPGIVETIQTINGRPRIVVSFECRAIRGRQYYPAVRAGITTTPMRYLEQRDPNIKAIDEPHFIPASLLGRPEELELLIHQLVLSLPTAEERKVSKVRLGRVHERPKKLRNNMTLDEA